MDDQQGSFPAPAGLDPLAGGREDLLVPVCQKFIPDAFRHDSSLSILLAGSAAGLDSFRFARKIRYTPSISTGRATAGSDCPFTTSHRTFVRPNFPAPPPGCCAGPIRIAIGARIVNPRKTGIRSASKSWFGSERCIRRRPRPRKTSPDSIQLFEPFTNLMTRPVSTGRRNYPVLIVDRVTWRCTVLLS
jgi:hypothetical protein